MNKRLIKTIFMPLHEKVFKRKTFQCLKDLESFKAKSLSDIERYQLVKLKQLLVHCQANVSYYRKLFSEVGLDPEAVYNFETFKKIPLLDKNIIRANINDLKAANYSNLYPMATGGSTGDPLQFFVDLQRLSSDKAARFRYRSWWGVDIGEPEVVIWGAPQELSRQDKLKRLRDWMFNSILLSAHGLNEEAMTNHIRAINRFQPTHIYGYPGAIYLLACFIKDNKLTVTSKLKVIFTTGEVLFDYQREQIEEAFGCPVAVEYGARDLGLIAHQCPKGKIHVNENIYLESLSNGEAVATNLLSLGMPLLRYRLGDLITISDKPCACGIKTRVLSAISGRCNDFLVTADKKKIHSSKMNHVFRQIKGVRNFRVVQKNFHEFEIDIVKDPSQNGIKQAVEYEFAKIFGKQLRLKINFPDNLKVEKSGKHKYVISEVGN